jgi:hypothetical protein
MKTRLMYIAAIIDLMYGICSYLFGHNFHDAVFGLLLTIICLLVAICIKE